MVLSKPKLELLTSLESQDPIYIERNDVLLLGELAKYHQKTKLEVNMTLRRMLIEVDDLVREELDLELNAMNDVVNNIKAQKLKMLGRGIVMAGNVVSLILLPITLGGSITTTVVGYAIIAGGVYVYKSKTETNKIKYQELYKRLEQQVTKYTDSWTHLLDSLGLDREDYGRNPEMFQKRLKELNDKLEEIEDNSNWEDPLYVSEFMIPDIKNIFTRMREQSREALRKCGPANVNVDQLNPAVIALVDKLGEKISDFFQNRYAEGTSAAAAAASTAGAELLSKVFYHAISFIVNTGFLYKDYKEYTRLQGQYERLQKKQVSQKIKAWDENVEGKRVEIIKEYEHYNLLREAIFDVMEMLV